MLTSLIVTWLLFYATGSQGGVGGAGHGVFGLAMAVGRVADAAADPLIGRWSDRTRTRFGRRVPFVLGGAIPMGALFVLLWMPFGDATPIPMRALRIAVTLIAFFALYTVVVCPYLAMLPEIAVDSPSRVKLAGVQAAGSIAGGGMAALVAPRLYAQVGPLAGGAMLATLAVLCFLAVGLAFARGPWRDTPSSSSVVAADSAAPGAAGPFASALRLVTGNPAFGLFLSGTAAFWIGLNIMSISLPYLVTSVLGLPQASVATVGLANLIGTGLALPLVPRIAARLGKVLALRWATVWLALCLPLTAIGRVGTFVAIVGAGPALAFVYTLLNPILAEITDDHRERTGDGEEALHFGAQGLALKGALAVAAWLAGTLFSQLGARPGASWGPQAAGVLAGLLCVVAFVMLGRVGHLLQHR